MLEGVLSDNETQLMSHAFESLVKSFKIIKPKASSYHNQTFGKIESFVRFFKNALACVTPQIELHQWNEYIDHCLFTYQISVSRVLGDSPFFFKSGTSFSGDQKQPKNAERKRRGKLSV